MAAAGADLRARFEAGESVVDLVHARAAFIDEILLELWQEHIESLGYALVAVGGYGRGELHPCSDVDVMLLLPDEVAAGSEEPISAFVTALWDIGLEAGHAQQPVDATGNLVQATLPSRGAVLGLLPEIHREDLAGNL